MSMDRIPPEEPAPSTSPHSDPAQLSLPDGELRIFEAEPAEGDLSRMYVLDVLGVTVSVYVRLDATTVIHLDTTDAISQPLGSAVTYEVNNSGTNHIGPENHHDPTSDAAETRTSAITASTRADAGLSIGDLNIGDRVIYMDDRTDMPATVENINTATGTVDVRTIMGTVVQLNEADVQQAQRST